MTDTPPAATDTPVPAPPSRLEAVKAFLGDLARPFSLYASAGAASVATVLIGYAVLRGAMKGDLDLIGAAAFIGAVWAGVAGLYWGKVVERNQEAKQTAFVEVAKTKAATANPPIPPSADGELPPSERIQ
jgi:hypothetical protein